jgi:hypothetical protein
MDATPVPKLYFSDAARCLFPGPEQGDSICSLALAAGTILTFTGRFTVRRWAKVFGLAGVGLAVLGHQARAAEYPFQDPSLPIEQRVADLVVFRDPRWGPKRAALPLPERFPAIAIRRAVCR